MKILNEIPVKTTNNFNINNLKIDLEVPTNLKYKVFDTKNTDKIDISYSEINNFNSKIGLEIDKALNLDITIKESIKEPIEFIYQFDDDNLIDNINITCLDNISANIVFKYISKTNNKNFHHSKHNINVGKNSNLIVTIVNLLNKESINLIASESNVLENGTLIQNLFDIGACTKINNYESKVNNNANSYLNNIYLGSDKDIIDMNYHYLNIGTSSITNIETQGVLSDKAHKNFRGTIDFISGCSKSIGKENENCVLLSDTCVSRSVPILLCGEEDVEGAHSVSSGKIEEDKLFYIMSRGIDEKEAKKMLILSNFNKIIGEVQDESLENELLEILEEKI